MRMERHSCPLEDADIISVKNFYKNEQHILSMQEDIHTLKNDVSLIKNALIGDGYNPGFKQRIEDVEKETEKLRDDQKSIKSYISAIVGVLGFIGLIFGILKTVGIL